MEGRLIKDGVRKAISDRQNALHDLVNAINQYANSDHPPLSENSIQTALSLNAPEAEWSLRGKYYVGEVNGKVRYMGELHDETILIIGTGHYFEALNAAKDAKTLTAAGSLTSSAPTPVGIPTNVVSSITKNRWTADSLIVSGTLTNSSAVAVQITGIDAKGFNKDQKMVTRRSDFTIFHNDLAPGEVVNFKVALKDDAKQVKFVQVVPTWTP